MKLTIAFFGGSLDQHQATVESAELPFEYRHNDILKGGPRISLTTHKPLPRTREVYLLHGYNSVSGIAQYHFHCDESIS